MRVQGGTPLQILQSKRTLNARNQGSDEDLLERCSGTQRSESGYSTRHVWIAWPERRWQDNAHEDSRHTARARQWHGRDGRPRPHYRQGGDKEEAWLSASGLRPLSYPHGSSDA